MKGNKILQFFFYKPYFRYLFVDIILLALSFFVVLMWFPLSTNIPFQKYDVFAIIFSVAWILGGYFTHRYVTVKFLRLSSHIYRLLLCAAVVFAGMYAYMEIASKEMHYSIWVLLTIWLFVLIFNFLFILFAYAYKYATSEDDEVERAPERGPQKVLHEPQQLDEHSALELQKIIINKSSEKAWNFIHKYVDVKSTNTYVVDTDKVFNFQKLQYYRYDAIIHLTPLTQIRGINKIFGVVNDKLPDNGLYICCFLPKSVWKKNFLEKFPPVIDWIFYSFDFLFRRVMPKVMATSRFYFDLTGGKSRVLSKAEVLGRLCYCGFEIIEEHKADDIIYVVARRSFRPVSVRKRMYGPLVKLNRVGKNGKKFMVYKFRTMHPYSEFLQQYIYDRYSLQEGGKFNHDIRVTTMGRFLRKYWLDELPMFINLFKGEMKFVGVRPLSQQYFNLYSQELQELRTQFKPGLLPPFYADMPKTLDEIQASEMKYLKLCQTQGVRKTDWQYFWKIVYTILFKRARSH